MSQIQLRHDDQGIANINIRITQGHGDSESAIFDITTDNAGNQGWPIPFWPVADYTLHVNKANVNGAYSSTEVFVAKPPSGEYADILITLERTGESGGGDEGGGGFEDAIIPTRLHVDGVIFRNSANQEWTMRGATFFAAYDSFLRGVDIRAALQELQLLGANCVRVFGMSKYVQENLMGRPPFRPQDHGNRYYDALPEFCDLCGSYGQYIYWSIFPDNGYIMPDVNEQVAHYNRMVSVLESKSNNILELTNEPNAHPTNAVDVSKFHRPTFPSCSGSYGDEYGGGLPPNVWDFGDFHSPRSYPKQVKDNCTLDHPIYLQLHKPVIVGEPDRFGSNGNGNIKQAAGSAGGAILSAGYVFHSIQGEKAEVFDTATRNAAVPVFDILTAA